MTDRQRSFAQVDVFTTEPYLGNPVAVVLDAEGLDDEQMTRFARWTNLSETTFVLAPSVAGADYRLRIFTPGGEIPFAGHPTLGTAHAWLGSGKEPLHGGTLVQQCGVGLVDVQIGSDVLSFKAPDRLRDGPAEENLVLEIAEALGIDRADVVGHQWADNGPGWVALLLDSSEHVRALQPDHTLMRRHMVGVVGPHSPGAAAQFEVRAFPGAVNIFEDPVTGSLNASIAQWLIGAGMAPDSYVATQGHCLGRQGVINVSRRGEDIWVGGPSVTCVTGTVLI